MDEHQAAHATTHASTHESFHCPGERHPIDRATHLGRLASYFPACRGCPCRHDTQGLASLEVRQRAELERRHGTLPAFAEEGFAGTAAGGFETSTVGRVAAALGVMLLRDVKPGAAPPQVVVGCDGHWSTAELLASACGGLQWTGCRTIEGGATSSPALASLQNHLGAQAALWIGNASGEPGALALKAWGGGGRPWSRPGELDLLDETWNAETLERPRRTSGGAGRAQVAQVYLPTLEPLLHALRPLRFVLDTTCQPLLRTWQVLRNSTACEAIACAAPAAPKSKSSASDPAALHAARLAETVRASGAHFGVWVDGDGECCQLVDESGQAVDSAALLLALAQYVCRCQQGARVVIDSAMPADAERALTALGVTTIRAPRTRQAMFESFVAEGATLGGSSCGRFWFATTPPAPDALLALCFWLQVLSQSDRPASRVLDDARRGEYN